VYRSACLCGWLPPTLPPPQAAMQLRHHAFRDCPVACEMRQQLNQALPPSRPCAEPNVWLIQALQVSSNLCGMWSLQQPCRPWALGAAPCGSANSLPLHPHSWTYGSASGWLRTSYFGSLAEFSQLCQGLPPPPSLGLRVGGMAHPFQYVSGQPPRLCLRMSI
jgi:hypothetical protein